MNSRLALVKMAAAYREDFFVSGVFISVLDVVFVV
jgi:hypothetical protein